MQPRGPRGRILKAATDLNDVVLLLIRGELHTIKRKNLPESKSDRVFRNWNGYNDNKTSKIKAKNIYFVRICFKVFFLSYIFFKFFLKV